MRVAALAVVVGWGKVSALDSRVSGFGNHAGACTGRAIYLQAFHTIELTVET